MSLGSFNVDLSGRTVMVTGASSGTGRHFAEVLAANGANVVITARRLELLDEVKSGIEQRQGNAFAVRMDVSDEASTIAAFDAAEARFGSVDSVVANAGIAIPGSALGQQMADFDQIVAVNLRGVFLTAREGARRMIAKGSADTGAGRIVMISSITGIDPSFGLAGYSATKAAVIQLGRVLARDWAGKGINVNVIAPGYMHTDMTERMWETETGKKVLARFPRQRIMSIGALDPLVLYLSSNASTEVTGSVFTVDDGQTL